LGRRGLGIALRRLFSLSDPAINVSAPCGRAVLRHRGAPGGDRQRPDANQDQGQGHRCPIDTLAARRRSISMPHFQPRPSSAADFTAHDAPYYGSKMNCSECNPFATPSVRNASRSQRKPFATLHRGGHAISSDLADSELEGMEPATSLRFPRRIHDASASIASLGHRLQPMTADGCRPASSRHKPRQGLDRVDPQPAGASADQRSPRPGPAPDVRTSGAAT